MSPISPKNRVRVRNLANPYFSNADGFVVWVPASEPLQDNEFDCSASEPALAYLTWMGGSTVFGNGLQWFEGATVLLADLAGAATDPLFRDIEPVSAKEAALTEYLKTRYEGFAQAFAVISSQTEDT